MNMKKSLAGVMAGAMAVSAMAATVSADQEAIVLTYDLKEYKKESDAGKATFTFDYAKSLDSEAYQTGLYTDLYFEVDHVYNDLLINKETNSGRDIKAAEISVTGTRFDRTTTGIVKSTISNTYKFSTSADDVLADPSIILVNSQTGMDPQNRVIFSDSDKDKYKEFHVPVKDLLSNYTGAKLNINDEKEVLYFDSIVVRLTYEVPAQTTDRVADGWNLWQANGDYVNWAYTDEQYKALGIDPYSTVDVNLLHLNTGLTYDAKGVNSVYTADPHYFVNQSAYNTLQTEIDESEALINAYTLDLIEADTVLVYENDYYAKKDVYESTNAVDPENPTADEIAKIQAAKDDMDKAYAKWQDAVKNNADVQAKIDALQATITKNSAIKKAIEDATATYEIAKDGTKVARTTADIQKSLEDLYKDSKYQTYINYISDSTGGGTAVAPTTVAATGLAAGTTREDIYPMKSSLNTPANVIEAISNRKSGGNHYTRPLAVLNDAIANGEEVTFTFTSFNGYVATHESNLYHQWVTEGRAYGYQTSKYDWYNPTFGQYLYTDPSSVNNGYSLFGSDNYDMYGSYSSLWGQNLFNAGLVVNEALTMQLNDTAKFKWGDNSLTFAWSDITADGKITNAYTLLSSMLLYTPVDWYWDTLTVTVGGESTEDVETGEGLDGEGDVIEEEESDIIEEIPFEEEPEEEVVEETEPEIVEEVVTESEVVEEVTEAVVEEVAPVEAAPSPQTGNAPVALAVIPVALAAAAVVAKKRS